MIRFKISAGQISDSALTFVGHAYSGAPGYVNDPSKEAIKRCGPIPEGLWNIGSPVIDGGHLGPFILPLTPAEGTMTYGRGGFWIHGDNSEHDESASEGCIIASPDLRKMIAMDADHALTVEA